MSASRMIGMAARLSHSDDILAAELSVLDYSVPKITRLMWVVAAGADRGRWLHVRLPMSSPLATTN
jgi:hypothetical protein